MEKIKVRIAIAINSDGHWHACGDSVWEQGDEVDTAGGSISTDILWNVHVIEIDVPKPCFPPVTSFDLSDIAKR